MEVIIFVLAVFLLLFFLTKNRKTKQKQQTFILNQQNKELLRKKVRFYSALSPEQKKHFEFKISEFLSNCKITGVETTVSTEDKLLIAASAIIPIFSFRDWQYTNLDEVLLYPNAFDNNFNTDGNQRNILGMVGTGYMEGKMILSKNALHKGFSNNSDKQNTAIHEFVHLIDKMDGETDGIPAVFMDKQYIIPWLDLIQQKVNAINDNNSDIRAYGGTNKAEFLAVVAEYFFERPKLLKTKHPKLYNELEKIFKQKPDKLKLNVLKKEINRNDLCPCGSLKKYKKCCGKIA